MAETKLFLSDKSSHRDKSKSVEIFYFDPFFIKLEFGYSCDTCSRPDLGINHVRRQADLAGQENIALGAPMFPRHLEIVVVVELRAEEEVLSY